MMATSNWTAFFYCVTLMVVIVGTKGAPLPNRPSSDGGEHQQLGGAKNGCPDEFLVKYKHASEVCQKETAALFKSLGPGDSVANVHAASGRSRRNDAKSSDKVDSEIVLCIYHKLKQLPTFTQIANLDKECTSNDSTKASDKTSSEEEDAETGLANCLMEKLEAMCPSLAAAV